MKNNQFDRKVVNILGVSIDSTTTASVLRNVQVYIQKKRKFYILTPNPELVLKAVEDTHLSRFIKNADISVPDGVGLLAAHEFLKKRNSGITIADFKILQGFQHWSELNSGMSFLSKLKFTIIVQMNVIARLWEWIKCFYIYPFKKEILEKDFQLIKGRELFLDLISLANKNGWKVFLLGGEGSEAQDAKRHLERNYMNMSMQSSGGPLLSPSGRPTTEVEKTKEKDVINEINSFSPQLLFIALGSGKQEKWLERNYSELKVGGGMVIGNTLRFVAGSSKVAPDKVSALGLEWLYRLVTGSQKLNRIINAVVVFPIKVLKSSDLSKTVQHS